jgi:hypothetical protein
MRTAVRGALFGGASPSMKDAEYASTVSDGVTGEMALT